MMFHAGRSESTGSGWQKCAIRYSLAVCLYQGDGRRKAGGPYFSRNWQLSRENGLLRGAYLIFPRRYPLQFRRDYFCKRWFLTRRFPCRAGRRRTGKIIGKELRKRVSQWLKMVEKSTGKSRLFTQEPFFITRIWRAIS